MLESVTIKHFRGFRELHLAGLRRVNLILGQNNVGKTALLEALAWVLSKTPADLRTLAAKFRVASGDIDEFSGWLFSDKNTSIPVHVEVQANDHGPFGLILTEPDGKIDLESARLMTLGSFASFHIYSFGKRFSPDLTAQIFSTQPTNPRQDAIDFNRLVIKRRKKQAEDLLRKVEPRLQSIESLQTGTQPLLYADIGLPEMIPVNHLGQGFNRLLDIYSELLAADAKVLLIDEIENGLHHSILEIVWSGLFRAAAELGIQIFATTHSWECVLAADKAAATLSSYDLNLIRLDRVDEDVKATVIDKEAFETAKQLHWEMR